MKLKVLSLVGGLAIIFVIAVIWKMDSFIREDRSSWAQAQMRTQIVSLQQTTESFVKNLQRLSSFFQSAQKDKNFWAQAEPIRALAVVRDINNPTVENTAIKEGSGLDDTALALSVKEIQGKKVDRGQVLFVPWRDSQSKNWILVVWPWAENRKLVLWAGAELLQGPLETHKGTISNLALVNTDGQVLAHTQAEYFGTRLADHPLFKEYKSSGSLQGGGSFKDNSGENLLGYFGVVNSTNAVVLSTAMHHELLADKNSVWASYIFLGLGLVLITLAGLAYLKPQEATDQIKPVFVPPQPLVPPAPAPPVKIEPKKTLSTENRHDVFKKIAASLGHELRGPIVRVLGFSQMIKDKEQNQDLAGYADSIIRETRIARDVLDKLFSFAQEKEATIKPQKIEETLQKVLSRVRPELQKRAIKVVENLTATGNIPMAEPLVERAIENIIQNSIEALERKANKEIKISTSMSDNQVSIVIEDNGEGMEPENLGKIFDPFFTTRSYANHMGLGLSAAYGVVKQHGGDIKVDSHKGHGTKVTITLPNNEVEAKANIKPPLQDVPREVPTSPVSFSPADVEIEKLLDFSEPNVQVGVVGDDSLSDLEFIDDDKTTALPQETKKEKVAEEFSLSDLSEALTEEPSLTESKESAASNKTAASTSKIDEAQFSFGRRTSPLDQYQVKIRRPRSPESNS